MPSPLRLLFVCLSLARAVTADDLARGVVVDQTSSPLPGVTVQVIEDGRVVKETVTSGDGRFALGTCTAKSHVAASLPGFEKVTVACPDAARIVLPLGRMTETVEVTEKGTAAAAESPTSMHLGTELSRLTLQRLPAASPHVRAALPLLPAVVRGADGLLRIDGVRPHESPLLIDGFNVTDPASGVSSIDLPVESVRATDVLRDPMAVTFGGALGSMVSIETRGGADSLEAGVQGFVPRPRLTGGGFGRLEGFSPRGFVSGTATGSARYLAAAEYDFDRIPVPGVTTSGGSPDTRQTGGSIFARVDLRLSTKDSLTAEGIYFPRTQRLRGLSPLQTVEASPTLRESDLFQGVVGRHAFASNSILTLRVGLLSHRTDLEPGGDGAAEITPSGRRGGFFSSLDRRAARVEAVAAWRRLLESSTGSHDLTIAWTGEARRLRGAVSERPVTIRDAGGAVVRTIRFGPAATIAADDGSFAFAVRDLWRAGAGLQIDAGLRSDWSERAGVLPSARIGFRYSLGDDATVVKGGIGRFVGSVPLEAAAFAGFPSRFDVSTDGAGALLGLRPAVERLSFPRALASNLRLEHRIARGWDGLLGIGLRNSSRLPTLLVSAQADALTVASVGRSTYREAEMALRRTWGTADQVFLSYTRSSARGSVDDFSSLFASADTEILQAAGEARLASDAPNRLLAWSTITLPAGFDVSPTVEWRSGFPYSVVDSQRRFLGTPFSSSFPAFFSLDLAVNKALTIKGKKLKLNVQLFNATNHFNPRDVFAVADAPRFRTFVNSVGPTIRGDIGLDW